MFRDSIQPSTVYGQVSLHCSVSHQGWPFYSLTTYLDHKIYVEDEVLLFYGQLLTPSRINSYQPQATLSSEYTPGFNNVVIKMT